MLIPALLFVLLSPLHSHIPHQVAESTLLHDNPEYVGDAVIHLALPDLTISDLDSASEVDFSNDLLHKKMTSLDLPVILLSVFILCGFIVKVRPRYHSLREIPFPQRNWQICSPLRAPPIS